MKTPIGACRAIVPALALAIAGLAATSAAAQSAAAPAAQAAAAEMTDGEVRKVDKEGGRLTLKHGEIKSLDMPPMTMVFAVKDRAMLDKLQAGDRIRFRAANEGGKFTLTELQVVR